MGVRDDALRALEDQDWSRAEAGPGPREVMIVHSTRFPRELSRLLEDEATRRGTNPSALIRDLVERALRPDGDGDTVTVRVSALRQEIEQAIRRAA